MLTMVNELQIRNGPIYDLIGPIAEAIGSKNSPSNNISGKLTPEKRNNEWDNLHCDFFRTIDFHH